MIAVQWAGIYNEQVTIVRSWAAHWAATGNDAQQLLGREIHQHLKPFSFSTSTCWLFVSIVLLGAASTTYNFSCPDEIKEFTRSQWEHALQKNVLHYWGLAWKHKYLRYACASFYVSGGAIFVSIMVWKLLLSFWYIIGYGSFLPF